MSGIDDFYIYRATIKRPGTTTGTAPDTELTVATDVPCAFMPRQNQQQISQEASWGQEMEVYLDKSVSVQAGDTMTITKADDESFPAVKVSVGGVITNEDYFEGSDEHKVVIVTRK